MRAKRFMILVPLPHCEDFRRTMVFSGMDLSFERGPLFASLKDAQRYVASHPYLRKRTDLEVIDIIVNLNRGEAA